MGGVQLTSAASAAFLRASSWSPAVSPAMLPPKVRGGPPTVLGIGAVLGASGGADPRTRPGWEKASDSDFPQQLPMALNELMVELPHGDGSACSRYSQIRGGGCSLLHAQTSPMVTAKVALGGLGV